MASLIARLLKAQLAPKLALGATVAFALSSPHAVDIEALKAIQEAKAKVAVVRAQSLRVTPSSELSQLSFSESTENLSAVDGLEGAQVTETEAVEDAEIVVKLETDRRDLSFDEPAELLGREFGSAFESLADVPDLGAELPDDQLPSDVSETFAQATPGNSYATVPSAAYWMVESRVVPVPEPSTWVLLGVGLALVSFVARRRLSKSVVDLHTALKQ